MKTRLQLFSLLFVLALCQNAVGQTHNSLRIAYINPNDNGLTIPEPFLARAQADGYTHIYVTYYLTYSSPGDWKNGEYFGGTAVSGTYHGGGLYRMLKSNFLLVNRYKMKMIPEFQVGTSDARAWCATGNNKMDLYPKVCGDSTGNWRAPCIATGMQPDGFDKTFREAMRVLGGAFDDAESSPQWDSKLGTKLEFVALGYSEALADVQAPPYKLLYGSGPTTNIDNKWLQLHQGSDRNDLVVASLSSRIATIRKESQSKRLANTRVIVYADLFDPEFYARADIFDFPLTRFLARAKTAGLDKSLVMGQWYYIDRIGDRTYDPRAALKAFTTCGFKTFYISIYCDGDGKHTAGTVAAALPHLLETVHIANDTTEPSFKANLIGFMSAHWDGPTTDEKPGYGATPPLCFRTMEYLAYENGIVTPDPKVKYVPAVFGPSGDLVRKAELSGNPEAIGKRRDNQ